ncbi:hypothetical protein PFICI_03368 [Pestalotiopsis fici W106-1]|uniref:Uncharacterized protein n=1 Tax=Pestalotiopsis fici (strain W106-1 / CGMCC3.15140) TaxID=1229662 RepID=W3XGX8_PESFW|nr:uncharacterized protein PFICI_03368 [Pestalotiopsis fici W106-1]ETS85343.1 hypothetical protein PFICI_03368 [Pestalotiopsis fici W106-1]
MAMELQAQWFSKTIKRCHDGVRAIESATGMRQFNHPHEKPDGAIEDWKDLDLISITRELSSFVSRFAFIKLQAETGEYLLEQMGRTTLSLKHEAHEAHEDQKRATAQSQTVTSPHHSFKPYTN